MNQLSVKTTWKVGFRGLVSATIQHSCSLCFVCEFLPKNKMTVVPRKRYVVKHNLITEVYLMTVMETTTCFGLYWPSSGCLGNLRASYMRVRAHAIS